MTLLRLGLLFSLPHSIFHVSPLHLLAKSADADRLVKDRIVARCVNSSLSAMNLGYALFIFHTFSRTAFVGDSHFSEVGLNRARATKGRLVTDGVKEEQNARVGGNRT